jgi:hypothetical protein
MSEHDLQVASTFVKAAQDIAEQGGLGEGWHPADVADVAGFDLNSIHRDSTLNIFLWVCWLQVTRQHMSQFRYTSLAEFLSVYPAFDEYEAAEQTRLMHTANWMHFLFTKIPAKKNKGLAIQVIPKLVEGWQARYVTGSGQTKSTADRVRIYEVEGGIQPYQRVKISKRKKPKKGKTPKRRKRVYTLKRRAASSRNGSDVKHKKSRALSESPPVSSHSDNFEYGEDEFDFDALELFADSVDDDAELTPPSRSSPRLSVGSSKRKSDTCVDESTPSKRTRTDEGSDATVAAPEAPMYENDTSSESVDADYGALDDEAWFDAYGFMDVEKPRPQTVSQMAAEGQGVAACPSVSSPPKFVRSCSWGPYQDMQLGESVLDTATLPTFPQGLNQHNYTPSGTTNHLFQRELNDSSDPFDFLLVDELEF